MTEPQKSAYIMADNKLAENAGWDADLLAVEFQYLSELDREFHLTVTGFETARRHSPSRSRDAAADATPTSASQPSQPDFVLEVKIVQMNFKS
jgi:hypothetical protein